MERPFVIHIHRGYGRLHYDLMLTLGEALVTWRLDRSPAELAENAELAARKLSDHRIDYLSYEGPISKGRGEVAIIDKGSYQLLDRTDRRWEVLLNGRDLRGRFVLKRSKQAHDVWTLTRLAGSQGALDNHCDAP